MLCQLAHIFVYRLLHGHDSFFPHGGFNKFDQKFYPNNYFIVWNTFELGIPVSYFGNQKKKLLYFFIWPFDIMVSVLVKIPLNI